MWERLPLVLALFTMKKVSLLKYDPVSGYLKNDTEEALDCCPIAAGILTLLRQFHEDFLDDYIGYIAQFINIGIANSKERKDGKIPAEVTCLLVYLEEFRKFASLSRIYIEKFIPAFLQDKIPTQ